MTGAPPRPDPATKPGAWHAMAVRAAIERHLHHHLLPFWRDHSVDEARGGFFGELAHDGTPVAGAAKGLILNARLLWTFAALFRRLGDGVDGRLMRRADGYLEAFFRDREHGGYRWRVDADGRPVAAAKKTYGQAFCVYALSEMHLATGGAAPLAAAREVFELIERHARDDRHGGYLEARRADWAPASDLRLSAKDLDAPKSMNTHLHLLEAYTNLYRAWPDAGLAARLRELLELFGSHILALPGATPVGAWHLRHFFDDAWRPLSDGYTYGHDIEAAWLLSEAAHVLGDAALRSTTDGWAVAVARCVLGEGIDADGALAYAGRAGAPTVGDREWWCQAEAVVGFWHAYELTGDADFAAAAERVWDFIRRRLVDTLHGEWHWRVRADGSVDATEPKVSEWKGPYHNVRMCLEMTRRIDRQEGPPA